MIVSTQNIRTYMKLLEADYKGPRSEDPTVSYDTKQIKGEIHKVIATLSSYSSGKYSRLAQNIKRMQTIAIETLELENQIKSDARDSIQELFNAEDAAYTRVVETVSFTLQLTKDPKAAETVQYAKVLKELEEHLTPELILVLESIKKKFSTINAPKPPSLSHSAKQGGVGYGENVAEGFGSKFKDYLSKILSWGRKYDAKLNALKSQLNIQETIVTEGLEVNPNSIILQIWTSLTNDTNSGLQLLGQPRGAVMNIRIGEAVFEISAKQVT